MTAEQRAYVVDSHHHFWDPGRRAYPWMAGLDAIDRPFGPDDLAPLLVANGVDLTVLVQTIPSVDETREFLATAAAHEFIAGVVGWVDLRDPHVTTILDDLADGTGGEFLVGIRHQVHDEDDPDWLLGETVQQNLLALAERNLVYDLLVRPRELPSAITVARDFPQVRFVLDHIAKPPIATGDITEWAALINEFAGLGNVTCKLSGMVTEANPDGWTTDDLKPYVETVCNVFGPYRLMFGSDWPVCLLAADYATVKRTLEAVLADLGITATDHDAIFGNTAIHWYGLDR